MHIEERKVTVREVTEGYFNDAEEGVVGYDDQLDIRPKYQREFVYKDRQRDEVIRTVMKGLPLNVMYWVDRGEQYEDDPNEQRYEVLDGQQRTISLCEYVDGSFSVDDKYFYNLPGVQQAHVLGASRLAHQLPRRIFDAVERPTVFPATVFVSVASGHLTLLAVGQVLQRSLEPATYPAHAGGGGFLKCFPICLLY